MSHHHSTTQHSPLTTSTPPFHSHQLSSPISMHPNTTKLSRYTPNQNIHNRHISSNSSVYNYQPTEYTTTTQSSWLNTSVSNWYQLSDTLQQQIDDKSIELRELVGKQYKLLIHTSDNVNQMQSLTNQINQYIAQINNTYYDIKLHCKQKLLPSNTNGHIDPQYNLVCNMDGCVKHIQQVWLHIGNHEYLLAINTYITSLTQIHNILQLLVDQHINNDQPDVQSNQPTTDQLITLMLRYTRTIQQFTYTIQHKATQCLTQTNNLQLHSDALCALILLHSNKSNAMDSILQQYMDIRSHHITHTIWCAHTVAQKFQHNGDAIERIVCDVYKRIVLYIIDTFNNIRILFSTQSMSDVELYEQYNITTRIQTFTLHHTSNTDTTPSMYTVPSDQLTTLCKQWYNNLCNNIIKPDNHHSLSVLLSHITNIRSLCNVRDTLFGTLNYNNNSEQIDTTQLRHNNYVQLDECLRVLMNVSLTSSLNTNTLFDNSLHDSLLQHSGKLIDNQFKQYDIVDSIDKHLKSITATSIQQMVDIDPLVTQYKQQLHTLTTNVNLLFNSRYVCTCKYSQSKCIYHKEQSTTMYYIRFTYYERYIADTLQPHIQRQFSELLQSIANALKQRLTAFEFKLLDATNNGDIDILVVQCLTIGRICYALCGVNNVQDRDLVLSIHTINNKLLSVGSTGLNVWSKHITSIIIKQYTKHIQGDTVTNHTESTTAVQPSAYVLQLLFTAVQQLYNAQSNAINNDMVTTLTNDIGTMLLPVYELYDSTVEQRCIDLTVIYTLMPLKSDDIESMKLLHQLIQKCNINVMTLNDAQQRYIDMLQQLIHRHRLLFGTLLSNISSNILPSTIHQSTPSSTDTTVSQQSINTLQLVASISRIPSISVSLYPTKRGHKSTISANNINYNTKHKSNASSISQTPMRSSIPSSTSMSSIASPQSAEYITNYGLGLLNKYTGTQYSTSDAVIRASQAEAATRELLGKGQLLGKTLLGKLINSDR